MLPTADFFSGVIAMGFAVCAVFFLRFWRRTRDSLFLVFSIAFLLLALNQALTSWLGLPLEERSWLYLLRLAAFLIIIGAIVRKNIGKP
jgi:membrane-associated PAP2 superfamily phosphatase